MIRTCIIIIISAFQLSAQIENEFQEYLTGLEEQFEVPNIRPDSLDKRNFLILDSREKEEYDVSHLRDAIWIGYDDFDMEVMDSIPSDTTIVIYCSVGYRSSKLARKLKENGYPHVFNLYGGIFNWANEGRPLYDHDYITLRLHAYNRRWGRYISNPEIIKIY